MPKRIVGVDIGQRTIRASEVEMRGKAGARLIRYHEVALPEGAVRSGEVVESHTVATALKHLWAEGKFSTKDVALGLGNQKVLARDLVVPKATLAKIRESLPFVVQELIPVPVADALLDFYPIEEVEGDTGPAISGLLVAAVKEAVMTNVAAVRLAGLSPVHVDLIPFALFRAIGGAAAAGTVAIVDIGANTTNVVLARDGIPRFVRIIGLGGDDLTRALTTGLDVDQEIAENIKARLGIAVGAVPVEHHRMVEIIYEASRELLNSVRNTLSFYVNTHGNVAIDRLIVTGGGAQLPGLIGALSQMTSIPVSAGDPFADVTIGKTVTPSSLEARHHAAVALGLALGRAA